MSRFSIFCAPDGRWTVWDIRAKEPAVLSGTPLIDLPKTRAETLRRLLERLTDGDVSLSPPSNLAVPIRHRDNLNQWHTACIRLFRYDRRSQMRIVAQPAKRLNGTVKELFDRPLALQDITVDGEETAVTLIVKDIYSKGSNQRYTITLSADDLAMILDDNQYLLQAAE